MLSDIPLGAFRAIVTYSGGLAEEDRCHLQARPQGHHSDGMPDCRNSRHRAATAHPAWSSGTDRVGAPSLTQPPIGALSREADRSRRGATLTGPARSSGEFNDDPTRPCHGRAGGRGLAIAQAFVANGVRVHIADVNAEAVQQITEQHGAISGTVGDISKSADLDTLFSDVQSQLGGLDVLVNNAGIAGAARTSASSPRQFVTRQSDRR
jgi:short chain dehydrogenase